jgi:flagellar basal-body rod protein FlgG
VSKYQKTGLLGLGTGAKLKERLLQTQGSLKESGRTLDFALTKPYLFFQVNAEGETRYTRDGAFYLYPFCRTILRECSW